MLYFQIVRKLPGGQTQVVLEYPVTPHQKHFSWAAAPMGSIIEPSADPQYCKPPVYHLRAFSVFADVIER